METWCVSCGCGSGYKLLITGRNEVVAKVSFYSCLWFCPQGGSPTGRTPWQGRPLAGRTPSSPGRETPRQGETLSPLARRPPRQRDPPGMETPKAGRPPWQGEPPWQGDLQAGRPPPPRAARTLPAGSAPPCRETPPSLAYGQWAAGLVERDHNAIESFSWNICERLFDKVWF